MVGSAYRSILRVAEKESQERKLRPLPYRSAHQGEDTERLYELDATDLAPD
jgi:hypothetical protein